MTFLKKIRIHPLLILFFLLSIPTGTFIQMFILFIIILLHEIGHYFMAKYFKWNIESVVLWIFGGVMKTTDRMGHSIKEDILVTIAGPLQHILIFIVLFLCEDLQIIDGFYLETAFYYNSALLFFNLIPVYPLDGGQILFQILTVFIPYKQAHLIVIRLAIITAVLLIVFQLWLFPFTFSAILILLFIIWENIMEWRNHPYIFMKFLLQRKYSYRRQSIIQVPAYYVVMDVFHLFKRNVTHQIKIHGDNKPVHEKDILQYFFNQYNHHDSLKQIINKM